MVDSINLDNWFPDLQIMTEIDHYLVSEWGIEYLLLYEQCFEKMEKVGRARWRKFEKLCKEQKEKLVTDAMADFDMHALHVSQFRRHYVLDLTALVYEWMERNPTSGKILDVGCQNGVLVKFLAQRFANKFVGIDRSTKAIAAAKAQTADLENVSFEVASLPLSGNEKFDLALCLDVLHHLDGSHQYEAVRSILNSLSPRGFAIIATATFEDAEWWHAIQPALNEFGCELVAGGRVGGAQIGGDYAFDAHWSSSGVGIFQMTGNTSAVTDVAAIRKKFELYWGTFFAPYANLDNTPWHEKTLGFEAAHRRKRLKG